MPALPPAGAGSSRTPLVKKLGYRPGSVALHLDAPAGFVDLLEGLPEDVRVRSTLRGRADLVMCFVTERRRLESRLPGLRRAIAPDGMAWIAWPKKTSGVLSDLSEDVIREVVLPGGDLVDVKVCAIDTTWSGLKIVLRKDHR